MWELPPKIEIRLRRRAERTVRTWSDRLIKEGHWPIPQRELDVLIHDVFHDFVVTYQDIVRATIGKPDDPA